MKAMKAKKAQQFKPEVGEKVKLFYDGKLGRGVDGVVIARRGRYIEVEFIRWGAEDEEPLTRGKFKRRRVTDRKPHCPTYSGYAPVPNGAFSIHTWIHGLKGDFYRVAPLNYREMVYAEAREESDSELAPTPTA